MAQPVQFHNPNAPFRQRQQTQQSDSASRQSNPPGWNRPQSGGPNPPPSAFLSPPAPHAIRNDENAYHQPPSNRNTPFHPVVPPQHSQFAGGPTTNFQVNQTHSQRQQFMQPSLNSSFPNANPTGFTPHPPNPPMRQSSPFQSGPGRAQQDFLNQFSQNPVAGVAMSTASDFIQKQSQAYIPGAYGVWERLKHYFTVDNNYVKNRLKILLFPFWHKNWRRLGDTTDPNYNKYAAPINDINAPDLYIPLMGFLTYILIVGYTKGASNQFSPDVIGADASYCLVMQLLEVAILASFLYLLNSSVSFLDLIAFSGYKYTSLVIDTICYQLFGSLAYYASLIYTGVALSYFTLNCMKGSVPEPTNERRSLRNYILFGVSCLQLILVCFISYTTAPRQ
uniref:Protein YIF1 n=1 Tax=Albugo laibachii Nc14 TaxID=890382 RepID=F0WGG6_9STRA|nr:conserved hypothetical protein [Albugo laibachii Nc14]|eukprot:CCA20329.1 conserved hypothetical protein [Albugo laibachii Nc14]